MKGAVIVDTGPLVALLNARDRFHAWAREETRVIGWPMFTCEAVIAEAFHLLRNARQARNAILEMVVSGVLVVPFRLEDEASALHALLERYADVPMSLADACIVRMSELLDGGVVFTVDSDFRVYRRHRRGKIPVVMPRER